MLQPCRAKDVFEDGFLLEKCSGAGQNQSALKTVPELATHWHSRGPQSKLHASSAVLGWGLATAGTIGMAPAHLQIFYTFSPANFSPAVLGWRLLTCGFFLADFSHAVLGWHRPGLPNSPQKKIINGIMAVLPQRLHVSRWKCKIHRKQKWSKESWYKSLVKNAKITENKNDQCNHATNLPLKMRKPTKTKTINGIMLQIFRKKRESQQKQKWSIEPKNNLPATHQSSPMPLAARHSFSKRSKSRVQ